MGATPQEVFASGWSLYQHGQWKLAAQSFALAAGLKAPWAEALHLQGVCLLQDKQHEAALPILREAVQISPQDPSIHSNIGLVLRALGRHSEALQAYETALLLKPDFGQGWSNQGNLLRDMGRPESAARAYRQALVCMPHYPQAQHGLGLALGDSKKWAESLQAFDDALTQDPNHAMAWMDRGNTLREMDRFEEALQSYSQAIQLRPQSAPSWSNRGVVLKRLGRFEEAADSYQKAIALDSRFVDAMVNYGTLLKEMMRLDEAVELNTRALAIDPENNGAHLNLAISWLVQGDFERGFPHYEWRWQTDQLKDGRRNFTEPQWTGKQNIHGKTVLLHAEQGLGDTLQFCRFASTVAEHGARVVLEVQEPLVEFLQNLSGVDLVVPRGQSLPPFDFHCPLLSLPMALELKVSDLPVATNYLHGRSQDIAKWQTKLGPSRSPRVGLVWSGRPEHKNDHNRSISFSAFRQCLVSGGQYHALQKEFRDQDLVALKDDASVSIWAEHLLSFSDTAALVHEMDLVISVDTSVAHLAAAMGKTVWLLLPFSPDWRWIVGREDSPWYPCMRLFRQSEAGQWSSVVQTVQLALGQFINIQRKA